MGHVDPVEACLAEARRHVNENRLEPAAAAARQALQIHPQCAEALGLLGSVAVAQGQLAAGAELLQQCLALAPRQFRIWHFLGEVRLLLGRWEEAAAAHQRAFLLQPTLAEAHLGYALARAQQGRFEEASYARAAELGAPAAWNNWGVALHDAGRPAEALAVLRRAVEQPQYRLQALYNFGRSANACGQFADASRALTQATTLEPTFARAWNELALALLGAGRLAEAQTAVRRALALEPQGDFWNNLGAILEASDDLDAAEEAYRQALAAGGEAGGGEDPETACNLAKVLLQRGEHPAALARYRKVLAAPATARVQANALWGLLYMSDVSPEEYLREAQKWDQTHNRAADQDRRPAPRTTDQRLRIGYVAADLRDHALGRNVLPLLAQHDHAAFHITCYASVRQPDGITQRLRQHSDAWRPIADLTDAGAAALIRADAIDILVDLGQHLSSGRLGVLALQPAPVQAAFAGYPGTTGMRAIAYRLSDPYLDPPGASEHFYTERTLRLAASFWCFDPIDPPPHPAPGELPLVRHGYCTFGSLNGFYKVSPEVLRLWAGVLRRTPHSRLRLLCPPGRARSNSLALLAAEGIAAERITFLRRFTRPEYLAEHQSLDICLDPFPYNGHTTSLEALWMGVPVITLAGRTAVGRGGLSQLTNLGLPELIARSPEEYVRMAAELAGGLPRLAALRATLRQRMEQSPLMDAARFARDIEAAYRTMWAERCAHHPPPVLASAPGSTEWCP